MKAIQVTTGFDINYPGGITNYVRNLHASLQANGVESLIISSETKGDFDRTISPNYFHSVSTVNRFPQYPPRKIKEDRGLINFIELEAPDLIHIHTIYGLSQEVIAFITASAIPYVISLHDYFLACPQIYMIDKNGNPCRVIDLEKCGKCTNAFHNKNILKLVSNKLNINLPHLDNQKKISDRHALMSGFLEHSSLNLPVSERVKSIFQKAYPTAKFKTVNIGNESASRFRRKNHSGNTTAAFLGTMNKQKGAELFAQIVKATNNASISYEFYGRGENKYLEMLASYGVTIKGGYKPSELSNILEHVDVGIVLPIWEDNGPQVVMELINNGIPVFGTNVGGIPDFVEHLSTGYLFNPDSPEETAEAIQWINNLTATEINRLMGNISPLKTNEAHAMELTKLYQQIVETTL